MIGTRICWKIYVIGNCRAWKTNKRTSATSCNIADSIMTINTGASGDGNIREYFDDLLFVLHIRYAMSEVVIQLREMRRAEWPIVHLSRCRKKRVRLMYIVGTIVYRIIAPKPRA